MVSAWRLHSCTNTQENSRSRETLVPYITGYQRVGIPIVIPPTFFRIAWYPFGKKTFPEGLTKALLRLRWCSGSLCSNSRVHLTPYVNLATR